MSVMFFGRPFANTRPFDKLFKGKTNGQYAHHVFRQFAAEYYGDARMSAQLYAAYLMNVIKLWLWARQLSTRHNAGCFVRSLTSYATTHSSSV